MLTVTDTCVPSATDDNELGEVAVVAPEIPSFVKYELTLLVTLEVSVVVLYPATRAPARDALVRCWTTTIARPSSIIPPTSVRKMGAITANSTSAAPRREERLKR